MVFFYKYEGVNNLIIVCIISYFIIFFLMGFVLYLLQLKQKGKI